MKWTYEKVARLHQRYEAGMGEKDLARSLRLSRQRVSQLFIKFRFKQRPGVAIPVIAGKVEEIKRLYASGHTLKELSVRYSVSLSGIWRALQAVGFKCRPAGSRKP